MKISKLEIEGSFVITNDVFHDFRGSFEVNYDHFFFESLGISFKPVSANHSYNLRRHTLRGMHYQKPPFSQAKLVSCFSGSVFDVIVDLRKDSATFLRWQGVNLYACSGNSVFIPEGCAHGFLTLEPNSGVFYMIEGDYNSEAGSILRWNDPLINIQWPSVELIVSEKDRNASDLIL